MKYTCFVLAILIAILSGCSSEEPIIPDDEPSQEDSDYMYLDFNRWTYAQMNHSYLWREDMPDSLDCDFEQAPKQFFESLLSPRDRFSYFTSNPYYSGETEYGFAYQCYKTADNRLVYQVLYIKNKDLKAQGMKRGDFVDIQTYDGKNVYTKLDSDGHSFFQTDVCFVESSRSQISTLDTESVLLDSVYYIGGKSIGYLCYLEFDDISSLEAPLRRLYDAGIDELIVDLRYNPGGYVNTCRYLCNSIVPAEYYKALFQQCSYNDILAEEYLGKTGSERTFSYFETPPELNSGVLGTQIVPLNQQQVIFLTSASTASASEAAIICLQPYMNVVVIGETTTGKGVGSWTIYDRQYRYALQPITMRYYNAVGLSTPDDGLEPDIYLPDGNRVPKRDIGDIDETMLSAALQYLVGESTVTRKSITHSTYTLPDLIPVGEPSFVTGFKYKQHNETF